MQNVRIFKTSLKTITLLKNLIAQDYKLTFSEEGSLEEHFTILLEPF